MAKNLIAVLKTFSKGERVEFRKFINSPYFNGGRDYNSILSGAEVFIEEGKKNSGADFWEYLLAQNGKIKYSGQTLKNRISELSSMSREFLVCNNMKYRTLNRKKVLLEEYAKRNLNTFYEKEAADVAKKIEEGFEYDFDLGYKDILVSYMIWLGATGKDFYRVHDVLSGYTMDGFLIYLFQYALEYEQQKLHNVKIKENSVMHILNSLDKNKFMDSLKKEGYYFRDEVKIHFLMYLAFSEKDGDKYYHSAKRALTKNIKKFSKPHAGMLFRIMTNYAINRMNDDAEEFVMEVFRLFDYKLQNGIYFDIEMNNFTLNNFRDYIFIGLKVKKLKWTEDFIKKYSPHLPEGMRENEINLAMAKLYFEKGAMERSLELVSKVKADNHIYYVDRARLSMKIFYETGMYSAGYDEVEKLRKYVRSHSEIPASHQTTTKRFMKNYIFILGIAQKSKKERIKAVRLHKEKTTHEWIKEKIEELV